MERYEDSFLQAGFNTVDQLAQITTQSVPISSFLILSLEQHFYFSVHTSIVQGRGASLAAFNCLQTG